ncbi:MAG: NAD(P)/FAD-dependent oxidoreductase [Hyphomicrobiales bacterium]
MPMNYQIAIAGAGIAGLSAALFLERQGHDVVLYDQFDKPKPIGSGLVLQPTGYSVLATLGLDGQIQQYGNKILNLNGTISRNQRKVLDASYNTYSPKRAGFAIQRAALFDVLYQAVLNTSVRLEPSTKIMGTSQKSYTKVSLVDDKGQETAPFDFIIDALGSQSPLSPIKGKALYYGALWANLDWVEDAPFATDQLQQRYRKATHMVGILPTGSTPQNSKFSTAFFWSLPKANYDDWLSTPIDNWKDEVLALWPETVVFLGQLNGHDDLVMARYHHRTLRHPVSNRVVHLGDSYHAASPQLGQGANMALLDAFALNQALTQREGLDAALQEYARLRRVHILIYQLISKLFTPVYQSDSDVLPFVRDEILAPVMSIKPMQMILSSIVSGTVGNPFKALGLTETFVLEKILNKKGP